VSLSQCIEGEDFRFLNGSLHFVFQPIFDLSNTVRAYEALARCQFYKDGVSLKNGFTPIGIENIPFPVQVKAFIGSILSFKNLGSAVQNARFFLNVNSSAFNRHNMAILAEALLDYNLSPNSIGIEITEHQTLSGIDCSVMEAMRVAGFEIALDDFGSGFSNIESVVQLPFNSVKFDRSFLYMYKSELGASLFNSLHSSIKNVGIKTVIEGVETALMFQDAVALGPTCLQGYFLGKELCTTSPAIKFKGKNNYAV